MQQNSASTEYRDSSCTEGRPARGSSSGRMVEHCEQQREHAHAIDQEPRTQAQVGGVPCVAAVACGTLVSGSTTPYYASQPRCHQPRIRGACACTRTVILRAAAWCVLYGGWRVRACVRACGSRVGLRAFWIYAIPRSRKAYRQHNIPVNNHNVYYNTHNTP
jgi:hypothetical protein